MSATSLRRAAFQFLDPSDGMSRGERSFNAFLTTLIVLTILTTMLSTLPGVSGR